MWWWLAAFRCGRCGEARATWQRALRSPLRSRLGVCADCVETWTRTGHRCTRCWMPITDRLQIGLLVETGAFVHVDCGGARLLGSPIAGTREPDVRLRHSREGAGLP